MNKTKPKTRHADIFFQLTRRHLLVFFKNKVRLMYTLLVPVIIFVVYILFLRDLEFMSVKSALTQMAIDDPELYEPLKVLLSDEAFWMRVSTLIDSWMISGILGLSAITVSLQATTVIVEDKQNGVNRDFVSSPVHRNILIASYFFYDFIVTIAVCLIFLLVCLIYLACMGEFMITFADFMTVVAVLLYSTIASTLMTVFISSFVKTEGTMASIIAIFSTAVGFLIGAYMPLGMLPVWVQGICGIIPGTYSCALIRYGFMKTPLVELTAYLGGAMGDGGSLIKLLTDSFGYNLNFFGINVNEQFQTLAITVFIILFLLLNIGFGKRLASILRPSTIKKKRDSKKKES